MIRLKHLKLFENFNENPYLTEQENKCIKTIYIFIRDILFDYKNQISVFHSKNPGNLSISGFTKDNYLPIKNVKLSSEESTLLVNFDEIDKDIKKIFPSLQKEFFIRFIPRSNDAGIKSKSHPLRIYGLEIGTTKLFNSPEDSLKSSLQHEIQHIKNLHQEGFEESDFDSSGGYSYLANKKEVDSHAKQFAYLYHKQFPGETKIDGKKLQSMNLVDKSKEKLNIYLWFLSPYELRKKTQISDELFERIKEAGKLFTERLKYYLNIYKQKT